MYVSCHLSLYYLLGPYLTIFYLHVLFPHFQFIISKLRSHYIHTFFMRMTEKNRKQLTETETAETNVENVDAERKSTQLKQTWRTLTLNASRHRYPRNRRMSARFQACNQSMEAYAAHTGVTTSVSLNSVIPTSPRSYRTSSVPPS